MVDLNKLSKEDLIKVVANMHDVVQDWDNGYGMSNDEADVLIQVGRSCANHCSNETNDWSIVELVKK